MRALYTAVAQDYQYVQRNLGTKSDRKINVMMRGL